MLRKLDLNITPKMHILTCHTIEQVRMLEGIAGKVEYFLEKVTKLKKNLITWLLE